MLRDLRLGRVGTSSCSSSVAELVGPTQRNRPPSSPKAALLFGRLRYFGCLGCCCVRCTRSPAKIASSLAADRSPKDHRQPHMLGTGHSGHCRTPSLGREAGSVLLSMSRWERRRRASIQCTYCTIEVAFRKTVCSTRPVACRCNRSRNRNPYGWPI